jgi:heat shock protein HslJ
MAISGTTVDVGRGGIEQAGCEEKAEDVEPRYIAALQRVTEIARDGDELVLTGPGVRLVFQEVAPPPTEDVVGMRWRLEGLVTGRDPGAEVRRAHPASLTLHRDGTVAASTGCRRFRGTWIEEVDTILFTEFGTSSLDECEESLKEQDGFVLGVLGDGFKAEVEKRTLTLRDLRGEKGLVYRRARRSR